MALTVFKGRLQSCNHGLPAYNNWADYVLDVDITVNSTPAFGKTWLWRDTVPSATQISFITDILHELGHGACLEHTQPQTGSDVMYPYVNAGDYRPDFSGDPDDALGIIHMLSLGRTLGVSNCPVGDISFYACPSPLTPSACSTRITTTNGIEDIPDNGSIFTASLYPNPYENNTVVHIETSVYEKFTIQVYDMVGQVLRQVDIADTGSFDVSLSGFQQSAGMYMVQVSDGRNKQVIKMIKM